MFKRISLITLSLVFLSCCEKGETIYEGRNYDLYGEFDIRIERTCSVPFEDYQRILIEVVCYDEQACFPDPDDLTLYDARKKQSTNYSVGNLIQIDSQDNIVRDTPPGQRHRTVWDMSTTKELAPEVGDFDYDGEPYELNFDLKSDCSVFPDHILAKFK